MKDKQKEKEEKILSVFFGECNMINKVTMIFRGFFLNESHLYRITVRIILLTISYCRIGIFHKIAIWTRLELPSLVNGYLQKSNAWTSSFANFTAEKICAMLNKQKSKDYTRQERLGVSSYLTNLFNFSFCTFLV